MRLILSLVVALAALCTPAMAQVALFTNDVNPLSSGQVVNDLTVNNLYVSSSLVQGVKTQNATTSTTTISFADAAVVSGTISANTLLAFTGAPAAGRSSQVAVFFRQDSTGGRTIQYPASVKWNYGLSPTLITVSNTTTGLNFMTYDGGNTYIGGLIGTGM